jgi:hypothetical protein
LAIAVRVDFCDGANSACKSIMSDQLIRPNRSDQKDQADVMLLESFLSSKNLYEDAEVIFNWLLRSEWTLVM